MISDYIKQTYSTYSPPPELTVSQWADQYRVLSSESCAEPGQWMTERAEYQRGIMDAVNDSLIEDVVVKSSSQIGKTEILNNIIGYYIDQDPSPLMIVQPTLEMAKAWSKDRFAPMVRDTGALHGKIKDAKSRDSENNILHKIFHGGNLTISGANSPATLAGRPKRIVIGDEVDRFPISAGTEGDPVNLLFKRTTAFWNRKRILFSTPTNQYSRILKAFKETDQRYYFVPCPKCGEFQILKWKDRVTGKYFVKWDKDEFGKDMPDTAYYECCNCESHLYDSDILWMVRNGEWRATAPFKGKAGFFINELYSPWVKLKETVQNFIDSKDDIERLKVWMNTAMGEVFEERGDAPAWEKIYLKRERYQIGKIPRGGLLLVAGADVQKDRVEVEIVAYGRGRQSWSVDYRVILGDISLADTKKKLDELMQEKFDHEGGGFSMIRVLAIDSGFSTQEVYNWVRRYPPNRVMAIKGTDKSSSQILGLPRIVDVTISGKKIERGARYWPVGVSVCKTELYGLLRLEKVGGVFPDGYCHFPEYDEEFFKGLTAEDLVIVGRRPEWRKTRERNEQLDCRNYARAAAAFCGIDRFVEATWDALEKDMTTTPEQRLSLSQPHARKGRTISKGITV